MKQIDNIATGLFYTYCIDTYFLNARLRQSITQSETAINFYNRYLNNESLESAMNISAYVLSKAQRNNPGTTLDIVALSTHSIMFYTALAPIETAFGIQPSIDRISFLSISSIICPNGLSSNLFSKPSQYLLHATCAFTYNLWQTNQLSETLDKISSMLPEYITRHLPQSRTSQIQQDLDSVRRDNDNAVQKHLYSGYLELSNMDNPIALRSAHINAFFTVGLTFTTLTHCRFIDEATTPQHTGIAAEILYHVTAVETSTVLREVNDANLDISDVIHWHLWPTAQLQKISKTIYPIADQAIEDFLANPTITQTQKNRLLERIEHFVVHSGVDYTAIVNIVRNHITDLPYLPSEIWDHVCKYLYLSKLTLKGDQLYVFANSVKVAKPVELKICEGEFTEDLTHEYTQKLFTKNRSLL